MYHYLKDYIQKIDDLLESSHKIEPVIIEQHLIKIQFFQLFSMKDRFISMLLLLMLCFY